MAAPNTEEIRRLAEAELNQMVELRREVHRHPELGFEEHRTTALIDEAMSALGLEKLACPTTTGSAWRLEGGGGEGRGVLLRADIDALPIEERSGEAFSSEVAGVMHACGHDAHLAQLIGAAATLSSRADELPGRYVFVFQPAEEGLGGAEAMVEGGLLEGLGLSRSIGCHLGSIFPAGMVGLREGITMAAYRELHINIHGIGGHGAAYTAGANPLLAAAVLAQRLGDIVEDLTYEGTSCQCTAGQLLAGTAANVIPEHASLRGTLRTFTDEQQTEALGRLDALLVELGDQTGCHFDLSFAGASRAVRNDATATAVVRSAGEAMLGADKVFTIPPLSPSEDVSVFMDLLPGCFFFVGAAKPDGSSGMHHEPSFAIDEACMPIGAGLLAAGAIALSRS
jgi:amidohydrolase